MWSKSHFIFILISIAVSTQSSEKPEYRILESNLHNSSIEIRAIANNGYVAGLYNSEKSLVFVWQDQNGNVAIDEYEIQVEPEPHEESLDPWPPESLMSVAVNSNGNAVYTWGWGPSAYFGTTYLWKGNNVDSISNAKVDTLDINIHSEITGALFVSTGSKFLTLQAYYHKNEIKIWIPQLGGLGTGVFKPENAALAINDSGTVVGWSDTGPREYPPGSTPLDILVEDAHAFVWKDLNNNQDAEYQEILDLGQNENIGDNSVANGINDLGAIVGDGEQGGFMFHDLNANHTIDAKEITILSQNKNGLSFSALDINNNGVICGSASNKRNTSFAAIWQNNEVTNLNDCISDKYNLTLLRARQINDQNWIYCETDSNRGVVLIPKRTSGLMFEAYE